MGYPNLGSGCSTNNSQPAPNPSDWVLEAKAIFKNSYVLKIKYKGCTNYEGVKIIVYKGKFKNELLRDPHFSEEEGSPIARFRPDTEGVFLAMELALTISRKHIDL